MALVLLFAAIFSTISVIEDRHSRLPAGGAGGAGPRAAIVAGKVLGGATLAWLQGAVFLALAPLSGIRLSVASAAAAAGVLALLSLGAHRDRLRLRLARCPRRRASTR